MGPLGVASHLDGMKKVAVIGGGLGVAIAYPQAKALHDMGAEVDVIVGFRNTDLMILMDELKDASTNLYVMTDDGSNGHKGFVTSALEEQLNAGKEYDHVIAIGPLVMMRAVVNITKPRNIPTVISMNPIMIDGTGMCGCCRVTVGGEMKFACVDGPDFDGFLRWIGTRRSPAAGCTARKKRRASYARPATSKMLSYKPKGEGTEPCRI